MLLGLCSRWDWKREQYRGPPRGDQSVWGVARARKAPLDRVLSALMKCAQLQGHSRGALPGQASESGAAEAAGVLMGDEELTGGC